MDTQLRETINEEITAMIHQHLGELGQYMSVRRMAEFESPEMVIEWFNRLAAICVQSPVDAANADFQEASALLAEVKEFIRAMNQDEDRVFLATPTGEFIAHCTSWCESAADHFRFTLDDVWDIIAPVVPDHMEEISHGVFEAQWWYPVPQMDIEILMRTDDIVVMEPPYEPAGLPDGLGVRFSVTDIKLRREAAC